MRSFFRALYRGWMRLAHALGRVNTAILLSLFYYLVITPVGFVRRLTGNDPLPKKPDPGASTYWIPRESKPFRKEDYLRQF
jgi:hypothetical protein